MTHPEKYARPGLYLDTDDHERLLEENREAHLRERRDRLRRELEQVEEELRR
jgi:hypothetical protein